MCSKSKTRDCPKNLLSHSEIVVILKFVKHFAFLLVFELSQEHFFCKRVLISEKDLSHFLRWSKDIELLMSSYTIKNK